jgi:hypothetical protein
MMAEMAFLKRPDLEVKSPQNDRCVLLSSEDVAALKAVLPADITIGFMVRSETQSEWRAIGAEFLATPVIVEPAKKD